MTKTQKKLVPQLRFPEFKNAPEWEEKKLGELGIILNGLTYSPDDIRDNGLLVLRSSNIDNGIISLKDCLYVREDLRNYHRLIKDDILICVRNGSSSLIGKNALIPESIPMATHGAFMTVFRAQAPKFVYQLFQTQKYKKQVLADIGARINSINTSRLRNYSFYIPLDSEQQKIADCLTSLDDLISAETRQLDALKKYKKGLMQNLFPRDGETTPRLRFPEFKNSGEWVQVNLGKLFSFKTTNCLSRDKLNYKIGTVKNIHYGDIHTKFSVLFNITREHVPYINPDEPLRSINSDTYCQPGDLVFADASEDLADIGKAIEIVETNNEKLVAGLHTILARPKPDSFYLGFSGYLFQSKPVRQQIQKESQGTKVLGISAGRLSKIILTYPHSMEEQQKITDCLIEVEKLMSNQITKLDNLFNLKKALMQKLFPR